MPIGHDDLKPHLSAAEEAVRRGTESRGGIRCLECRVGSTSECLSSALWGTTPLHRRSLHTHHRSSVHLDRALASVLVDRRG